MTIKYKIIELNEVEHHIVVRFYDENMTEDTLATERVRETYAPDPEKPGDTLEREVIARKQDGSPIRCRTDSAIPLPVPAPTGEELHKLIVEYAPRHQFEVWKEVKKPEVVQGLQALQAELGVERTVPEKAPAPEAPPNPIVFIDLT